MESGDDMSVSEKMISLADAIRDKSLTQDKMGLDDMTDKIGNLTLNIDETQNMLSAPNDFNNTAWSKPAEGQVGQDGANGPLYAWIKASQLGKFVSQVVVGAKTDNLYVWKFYARADHPGDKIHTELFGGSGYHDFSLNNRWRLCLSAGKFNNASQTAIYFGQVSGNKGAVSVTMPVFTEFKLGG